MTTYARLLNASKLFGLEWQHKVVSKYGFITFDAKRKRRACAFKTRADVLITGASLVGDFLEPPTKFASDCGWL